MICQDIDGGATEGDGGASAPVGPSVATPLLAALCSNTVCVRTSMQQMSVIIYKLPCKQS